MKEKDHVKRIFSKNREAYVSSSTHSKTDDLNTAIDWLQLNPQMIALDIATGGGHVAKKLSKHVANITASDITKEMLENTANHLQSYPNIDFHIADAENLPFPDERFDIVTCRIAAHHFPRPDIFINEVQRVLRPGGQFLFIDNVAPENLSYDNFMNALEKMRDYSHVRALQISQWKQFLQANGLSILKQRIRKKTLPFTEWINRTMDHESAMNEVSKFILDAPKEIQDYYQVTMKHGDIHSFTIDEWMVLSKKFP